MGNREVQFVRNNLDLHVTHADFAGKGMRSAVSALR